MALVRRVRAVVLAAGLLLLGIGAVPPAQAAPYVPVIAMLDTGVNPHHQEFDYGGPSDATDQFVGWWDFSYGNNSRVPATQAWDPVVPEPYDSDSHGTLTASLAAGNNRSPLQTPSFSPGAKLAIAKVVAANGTGSPGGVAAAIRWAVDVIHADVVNISLGTPLAVPAVLASGPGLTALRYARAAGVLVVVANGNGLLGLELPGSVGELEDWPMSPDVLAVGGSDPGFHPSNITWDPEVTAQYRAIGAAHSDNDGYRASRGTSLSSPLVAGFAARLITAARDNGRPASPDYIETLIKYSARDTALLPTFEGYGVVDAAQLPGALAHAAAGTLPAMPTGLNPTYVDTISQLIRQVWGGILCVC